MKIALPKEYLGEGVASGVKEAVLKAAETFRSLGAVVEEVSLPHSKYWGWLFIISLPHQKQVPTCSVSMVSAMVIALKNVKSLDDVYVNSRSEGFGEEVKRRIMLGTFSLSAGYYDAYFKKAGQVRTLIKRDFEKVFADYDLIIGPSSPTVAFGIGENINDPITMYMSGHLNDPCQLGWTSRYVCTAGLSEGLPVGLQIIGNYFDEKTMYQAAYAFEQATEFHHTTTSYFRRERRMNFETVIGLEVHVELKTNSKIFSPAPAFWCRTKQHTNVIDWGYPGVLPVMNKAALEFGMKSRFWH